jgi:hypothetical protein
VPNRRGSVTFGVPNSGSVLLKLNMDIDRDLSSFFCTIVSKINITDFTMCKDNNAHDFTYNLAIYAYFLSWVMSRFDRNRGYR